MKRIVLFFVLSYFLIGCVATPKSYDYPAAYMVEKENMFDYQPGFECSAFSSAYLLRHYGTDIRGLDLYKTMPDKLANGGGVYPSGIIKEFESRGFHAQLEEDGSIEDLKQEISKGNPLIVYIHVNVDDISVHNTHYVPVVGYDEEYIYFAESLEDHANCKDEDKPYNRKTDIASFKKLWANVEGLYEQPYFLIEKL